MIWIVFAAMVALALLVLLRPLLAAPAAMAARSDYDLMVYKDQLGELSRDVERGLVNADQAEAARTEIQRRMLAATDGDKGGGAAAALRKGKVAPVIITVLVPVLAVLLYLPLGAPELPDSPYAGRVAQINEMKEKAATIQAMVTRLAERLRQDPSDGKGWAMLGRSYRAMGMAEEAKDAYRKAVTLLPSETQARIELAIMLLEEAEGDALPDEAVLRLEEVLAITPDQPDALYFTGLSAAMKGDSARAKARWNRLLMVLPADSPARGQVEKDMARLK
ncbi:c-type cytochrome biogenesis protein CcmI [Paramagnetospirillum magneticum]|uniref:Cytochrome c-type biogenesis protein cycH n=1 Tax=Paramagnetospirillum magneticum (strain ATCC 700264 / AMB-1) TaxID=342108 RepID=Q2VZG8_PARM1|nr:c-type cytochrome biogenesis protein CcmI [Paramagnetospirillum magneticum]BAE53007.1 Cytochrome c-type biogenesis protein cycH [Paramagnetospirillum magneticum AMB-1]